MFIGDLSGGNPFLYAPDKSRPAINDFNQWQTTNRGTWQVSARHKIESVLRLGVPLRLPPQRVGDADSGSLGESNLSSEDSRRRPGRSRRPARLLIEAGTATEFLSYGPYAAAGAPTCIRSPRSSRTATSAFSLRQPDTTGSAG